MFEKTAWLATSLMLITHSIQRLLQLLISGAP
jgi:hypothetical protein